MSPFATLIEQYDTAIASWNIAGISLAKNLFTLLAGIQVAWAAITWAMNRTDGNSLIPELARMMIGIGFFWAVLLNYDVWIPAIYTGLRQVGSDMTGVGNLSPGDILDTGQKLASKIFDSAKSIGFWDSIGGTIMASICGFVIFLIFVLIAAELAIVLVGGKIILAGGLILLGLSGTKWTMSYAERYFTFAIALGIRLLFLTLIVGLGQTLADGWIDLINNPPDGNFIDAYLAVLGAALLFVIFARKIPEMAVAGLTGNIAFSGFSSTVGAVAATGAQAGVAAGLMAARSAGVIGKEAGGSIAALRAATGAAYKEGAEKGMTGLALTSSVPPNAIKKLTTASGQVARESVQQFTQKQTGNTLGGKVADKIKAGSKS